VRRLAALGALLLLLAAPSAASAAGKGADQQRIVALTPFAANTLAELGVTPVGVGQTLGGRERYSPKLKGVEVLPLSHPNGPNLEQLASLDPDLVLSSRTWAKGNQAMQGLGIEVIVHEPVSIAGALADTYKIGQLVGRKHLAREIVIKRRGQIEAAESGISSHPKVMLLLGVGRTPFTFLPNSWGGGLLEAAGAELMTAGVHSSTGFERISDEVVIAEDPDVIIAVPHANAADIPSLTEYLRDNPAWSSTTAARTGHVYVSVDNSLLQAGTDIAATIRKVRKQFLQN
jgi:ABC-type Fe3+-hydroxamate transport system substrate-binding protein